MVSNFLAIEKPWINSVTSGPTICAPINSPVSSLNMVLISPSESPNAIALPFPTKGNLPTLIFNF